MFNHDLFYSSCDIWNYISIFIWCLYICAWFSPNPLPYFGMFIWLGRLWNDTELTLTCTLAKLHNWNHISGTLTGQRHRILKKTNIIYAFMKYSAFGVCISSLTGSQHTEFSGKRILFMHFWNILHLVFVSVVTENILMTLIVPKNTCLFALVKPLLIHL